MFLYFLLSAKELKDSQNIAEEVDEVQVEVDGSQDVLLGGEDVHDEMCVEDNEATDDHGTCYGQHKLQGRAPEE